MKGVHAALKDTGLEDCATIVLIGSHARDVASWRSDVDILVLSDDGARLSFPSNGGEMHLQRETRTRFLDRLDEGDDYPMWALRFGIPQHDPDDWWAIQVDREKRRPHWPDWTTKVDPALKRMRLAGELLETRDRDAAAEEYLYAASHIARATLLRSGVFPSSRPEIPGQLAQIDSELDDTLEELIDGDPDLDRLPEIEKVLKNRLLALAGTAAGRQA